MTTRHYVFEDSRLAPSRTVTVRRLVDDHADFLWRTLHRMGVPEALLDDAIQQVFLIAHRKLGDIQLGSERSFLLRTAMHTAAHIRRTANRKAESPLPDDYDAIDPQPSAEDLIEQQRARRILYRILDEMPEELRAVFVLYELEEATAPEISELLRIPLGTAASRLRRAREEFRRLAVKIVER